LPHNADGQHRPFPAGADCDNRGVSESTVEIHLATVADLPEVRTVRLRALQDAPYAFASTYEREAAFGDADWVERLTSGSSTFLARVGGTTVGTCTGLPPRDDMVELVAMWVDPAVRGFGVAAELVHAVSAWAADQGADRVHLWVTVTNGRAKRFYEKLDFVLTGEQQPLPSDPGVQEFGMVRFIGAG
jgi:GNAT superfamily N-acetyltransferase